MLRLARAQAHKWWSRPVTAALVVGACAGAMEWVYEGLAPSEWRLAYVFAAIASLVVSGVYTNIHCRERREVLLRMLPVSELWPAVNRVLVPILLYLIGCATTLAVALLAGAFEDRSGFALKLVAFMAALLVLQQFELLWMELRPRLDWMPFSRAAYFILPGIMGAVVGFLFAASDFDLVAILDLRFLIASSVIGLLLALWTVALYLRRTDFVSRSV